MVIKENDIFCEQIPTFGSGTLSATTYSNEIHDIYLMKRDDYFNKSKIDYSLAVTSKIGVLNAYLEYVCVGTPLVVVVKNNSNKSIELKLILEHKEQKPIITSAFGTRIA